jgi:AcrR family transcriptional regulator
LTSWGWRLLTFGAVAERADASVSTVYRYFSSEQERRDAVMRRFELEAGVGFEDLTLSGVATVAGKMFAGLARFAVAPRPSPDDPIFVAEDEQLIRGLRGAVDDATAGWSDVERAKAAAVLDVLWSLPSYERLITAWHLQPKEATAALRWAIEIIVEAIHCGRRPSRAGFARTTRDRAGVP